MARLTSPAIPSATITSTYEKPHDAPSLLGGFRNDPVLRQRRVQVDGVRHHRRADDTDGQE